jgi:malonate transporter
VSGVLTGFALVFALVIVGVLVSVVSSGTAKTMRAGLSPTIYYVTNPALLFVLLSEADLHAITGVFAPLALLVAAVAGSLHALICRFALRRRGAGLAVGAMAASYANAGNIGLPIALYAVGTAAPAVSVLVAQLLIISPLYLCLFSFLAQRRVPADQRKPVGRTVVASVASPVTIAAAIGAAFSLLGWSLPDVVMDPISMLGDASVPLLLLFFGLGLRGQVPFREREVLAETVVATLLKVIAMPALAWVGGRYVFGLSGQDLLGVVVMAALPTAQNVYLFAHQFRMPTRVASDVIIATSVLSFPVALGAAWLLHA